MKNGKILKIFTFTISIVLSIAFLVAPVNASLVFSDLTAEHWCYDKIIDFEEKGFICGYEDGTFRPDQTITRAEYVKIVNNFFGYELEYDKDSGFSDIKSGDWFIPYVNEAVERGYITGYEDGTFRPEDPIRRQEATVILARILDIDEEEYPADHVDGLAQYSDGEDVEDWARVAIHSYSVYNFINGYEDGSLRILQDVTRAETVELLHILEQQIIIPEPDNGGNGGNGGGGGYTGRVAKPVITAYEQVNDELTVVPDGKWVNMESAYENGSLIKITCETNGATIIYSLDNWKTKNNYQKEFVVLEGINTINAYAVKFGPVDSYTAKSTVKVDTVAPTAQGLHEGNLIKVLVEDYDHYGVGNEKLSGVSGESLRYAWFIYDEDKGDYVRETPWTAFENNEEIEIPDFEGAYYLGVKGSDVAGNKMGTGILDGVIADEDDEVDFPNTDEDDEPTEEPFIIINEIGKSYILNIFSGANISSVIGSGEYEYASMVTIDATIVDDDKYYEFFGWTGDTDKIANFDEEEKSQSFKMPATNLTLTAYAEEMDVDLFDLEVIGFSGDDTKDIPEPGDWIEYEFSIKNLSELKDIDLILELSVSGESGDISGDKSIELTVEKDGTTKIKFIAQMNENFGVYEQFFVDVVARPKKNTEVKLDEISLGTYTEKMSGVRFKQRTNKNIVMLIDVSGSMGFCTEHPQVKNTYYGLAMTSGDLIDGDYSGDYHLKDIVTGKKYSYNETKDYLYYSGELIINYDMIAEGPWKGHSKTLTDSGDICRAPARIEVLIDALVSTGGFIDTLAAGAEKNEEDITITLVTFSGYNDEVDPKEKMATIIGTFGIKDTKLKNEVRKIKYDIHHGTYINTGLEEVVKLFDEENYSYHNELLSDGNVENYFIFFGDGAASDMAGEEYESTRKTMISQLITGPSAKFDYSYAIGFGSDFAEGSSGEKLLDSLLKNKVDDEDKPIKATNAATIVKAFKSIANSISTTAQTQYGKLSLSGDSFDDAVENNKVFPIAVMDGTTLLFTITATSAPTSNAIIEVPWDSNGDKENDVTTKVEFKFEDSTLNEIVIDLSGTAFSDKKQLNVVFDKQTSEN